MQAIELQRRVIRQLMTDVRDATDRADALLEENRVLKLANATLARRLDDALGPAWERREGERE